MTEELLSWYDKKNYNMPWRIDKNPYRIWISEIMLQQTQVKTVMPYYEKWMTRYPTTKILAESDIDDVLKLWEGLGYYRRAHNIKKSAEYIWNNLQGEFPKHDALKKLPGIGDYTYSAIMSIAFGKRIPAIDGNVKRVFSRIFEQNFIKASDIRNLSKKILEYMPEKRPGCFNQAIMDLGREICKPKNPKCSSCPIDSECKALINDSISKYPKRVIRKKIPVYDVVVAIIFNDSNRLLITKRPINKMLGGLWELPGGKKEKKETIQDCIIREIKEELNVEIKVQKKAATVHHAYSHFKIKMHGYYCKIKRGKIKLKAADEFRWIKLGEIDDFSFPTASHKLFDKLKL